MKYVKELKDKIVRDALNIGTCKAAKINKVSPQSIVNWLKKQNLSLKRKRTGREIKCPVCGNEFYVGPNKTRYACSQKCRLILQREDRLCKGCGSEFNVIKSSRRKFCSHECYALSNRIDRKRGRGSNWNTIKRRYKKSIQICLMCKEKISIDLHHIIPYSYFKGDYERANSETNLAPLCQGCHRKAEKRVKWIFNLIQQFEAM